MGALTDEIFAPKRPGYFGSFGGAFVPEILRSTLDELIEVFDEARADKSFGPNLCRLCSPIHAVQRPLRTWKT